tara:strand:+ start:925 stop:1101 length:177 start_codon:yes stop_codon:yes gene_type:complete
MNKLIITQKMEERLTNAIYVLEDIVAETQARGSRVNLADAVSTVLDKKYELLDENNRR